MNEIAVTEGYDNFSNSKNRIGHNETRYQLQRRYHTRYHTLHHTFFLSLTWIGHNAVRYHNFSLVLHAFPYIFSQFSIVWSHLQRVSTQDHQIYKKTYINIFLKKG